MNEHLKPEPAPTTGAATPPKGIFTRFALRSLKMNHTRTVVSIIGIALSCALITAIFTSVSSLLGGLLQAELARGGSWQVQILNLSEDRLEDLKDDNRVEGLYVTSHYGQALMPMSFQGYWGRYIDLQDWPTEEASDGLLPLPDIVEGRAPKTPGEIVLPSVLKNATVPNGADLFEPLPDSGKDADAPRASWEGQLELNDTVDLALGQRMFHDEERGIDRACIPSEGIYTTSGPGGSETITEWLANVAPAQHFKVVGFYEVNTMYSSSAWDSSAGYTGFVGGSGLTPYTYDATINTNLTSRAAITDLTSEYTGMDHTLFNSGGTILEYQDTGTIAQAHDALLRYQGMLDERTIWGTLYSIGAILAIVVIVASVSLIYNSFAIAVSERTRQFGLLSSLGASKRQLRRTVYVEALVLAAVGIPLGIVLGIAGTWVVFNIAGEGIGMLIDQELFAETGMSTITVSPLALGAAALLALVTVLISAAVPAFRASRTSAVDAIRQAQSVTLSRGERRRMKRAEQGKIGWLSQRLDALRMRFLGIPGFLAHRNLTRSSSKGRVAVASLAVSVALLITSGAIQHYMGYLTDVADSGGSDIEVTISRSLEESETTADGVADIDNAYKKLATASAESGTTPVGYTLDSALLGSFEAGVIDRSELLEHDDIYDMPDRAEGKDGTIYTPIAVLYVDNATWNSILDAEGLDKERFCDPSAPVALGLNRTQSNDGRRYGIRDLFLSTGTATLYTQTKGNDGWSMTGFETADDGEVRAQYLVYGDYLADTSLSTRPLSEAILDTYELPVGGLINNPPSTLAAYGSIWPTLILPAEALPTLAASSEDIVATEYGSASSHPFAYHAEGEAYGENTLRAFLSYDAGNARSAEAEMREILDTDLYDGPWHASYLNNNAENVRTAESMEQTIQLFISCFIVITTAIAVANVFNTLSSSIILRRREFAMLKSTGMGERAFRRMIALECLSYAWRGLGIGLALGVIVTFAVYQSMSISFAGLGFVLPLGWVVAAFCVVVGVLAVSTVYALRKSQADSIVQTLREDAI